MAKDVFHSRHIGPRKEDVAQMLEKMGIASIDQLINETVPANIRLNRELRLPAALTEAEYLASMKAIAAKNKVYRSYIGMGYYGTFVPPVIQRNVLENPGWYTAYTPYQAEIAQGRLEALLNFQTMASDLSGLEITNASLLDEGTAAAEAMIMFYNTRSRDAKKRDVRKFFVDENCFPQTIAVVQSRTESLGIDLQIGNFRSFAFTDEVFGAIVQYPDGNGEVNDYRSFVDAAHAVGAKVAVAADLMALVKLTPPGEWGADVAFGNTQRLGVPMGFGGPHAAYFSAHADFKRYLPGRIIGVSRDAQDNPALRMALQTREQHIRRDKATSNICTAQALLAVMAGMYVVWHGPDGMQRIANDIHDKTNRLAAGLRAMGYALQTRVWFDTLRVKTGGQEQKVLKAAQDANMNFRAYRNGDCGISIDETVTEDDLNDILEVFAALAGRSVPTFDTASSPLTGNRVRTGEIFAHPVFNRYHSETEMMRYLKRLENRDLSLTHSMIPLGSCTMKLNAAAELIPVTWPEFANMHPFAPEDQTKGYRQIIDELDADLSEITGFSKVSLQPNSGAQGEFAGLMVIRAFHIANGDAHRNVVLIPASAHGTNPASAVMAGMKVVIVKCDEEGNIQVDDLRSKSEQYSKTLSALMITYPSTHGVFEASVTEITSIVHEHGGQVYMDGANMNAQCGLTNPGNIGADVCHLNLHKTFAIPHGGGGPGMGPIGVARHLAPFLPGHPIVATGGNQAIPAVSSAPWGSALILLISYGYIRMLGASGVTESTRMAILNANYIKNRLQEKFNILYTGTHNRVAHEMIVDCRSFKQNARVEVEDIAKRLMDYGFHAPTVSFPVAGTLMIEPTESESLQELDRFCDALLRIHDEITAIENGTVDETDNVLKNAPHTVAMLMSDHWSHAYSRSNAGIPLPYLRTDKFYPPVARVDNAYGDRNLVCTCPPTDSYETPVITVE